MRGCAFDVINFCIEPKREPEQDQEENDDFEWDHGVEDMEDDNNGNLIKAQYFNSLPLPVSF